MELTTIQEHLASMKTHLELIDSNIVKQKQRKAELKQFVREDADCNKRLGRLKKDKRELQAKINNVIDFFKEVNNGTLPEAILGPLFAQPAGIVVRFIGYQQTSGDKVYEPMFEVAGLPGYTMPTTLMLSTVIDKGLNVPDYPKYKEWKKQRSAA